jgi:hypothetical protein
VWRIAAPLLVPNRYRSGSRRGAVLAVRLLAENLALYRSDAGRLGLVAQPCPHRGASLAYGIPEEDGLRDLTRAEDRAVAAETPAAV